MNTICLFLILLAIPFCYTESMACNAKAILSDKNVLVSGRRESDWTRAYYDAASCATLNPKDGESMCCYIKLKFKNENLDEKFTHKGCYEVEKEIYASSDSSTFKEFVDLLENEIDIANENITVKSLSIDCSSKFLHFVGLSILLFLL